MLLQYKMRGFHILDSCSAVVGQPLGQSGDEQDQERHQHHNNGDQGIAGLGVAELTYS
ncbi:hypothetical protein D3C71_2070640 [compost metagenome]